MRDSHSRVCGFEFRSGQKGVVRIPQKKLEVLHVKYKLKGLKYDLKWRTSLEIIDLHYASIALLKDWIKIK